MAKETPAKGSAAYDEEAAVLLSSKNKSRVVHMAPTESNAPKTWRGELLCCFSGCDVTAWASVGFFYLAPCVLFGFNMKKSLRLSVVRQSLIFFLFFGLGSWWLNVFVRQALYRCQQPPNSASSSTEYSPGCKESLSAIQGAAVVVFIVACIGIGYGSRRRTQIREKFGIAGSSLGDVCTWFWCAGPALCQEARTLWHNNVHDGVWFGPVEFEVSDAAVTQYSAPAVNTMSQNV